MENNNKQHLSALLIIAAIGFAFVIASGSLFSGYHFMDCSAYIRCKYAMQNTSWLRFIIDNTVSELGGRFRPLFYLNDLYSTFLWGDNMLLQGLWQIVENIAAAFLIYIIGRRLKWGMSDSLLMAGITLIGTQSAIFFQTRTIESIALIFLLLSWLSLTGFVKYGGGELSRLNHFKRIASYTAFVFFVICTALIKENFILTLPATYVFYCMIYDRSHSIGLWTTFLRTWKTAALLFVLTLAALASVLLFAGSDFGYAGMETSAGLMPYLKSASYLYIMTGAILAFAAIAFVLHKRKHTPWRRTASEWVYPVLLFAAMTLPQIVLYAKSNIIDRYIIPASLGSAFLMIFTLRETRKENTRTASSFWKNLAVIAGLAVIGILSMLTFNEPFRKMVIDFAVSIQGRVLQGMTSESSRLYLEASLTNNVALWIAGAALLIWGILRKWMKINTISELYAASLVIFLLFSSSIAFISHQRYTMRGHATEDFLHTIVNKSNTDTPILIAGNQMIDNEGLTVGISLWLNEHDRRNQYVCALGTDTAQLLDFYKNRSVDMIEDKSRIEVIAIFPGMEKAFSDKCPWFDPADYDRHESLGNFIVYSRAKRLLTFCPTEHSSTSTTTINLGDDHT
jgi:hypothetical protein